MTTIAEILTRYEREEVPRLSARTQKDYRRHIRWLLAKWGARQCEDLKLKELGQWLEYGKRGAINRGKKLVVLRNAYKCAIGRWFLFESFPFTGLVLEKGRPRDRYIEHWEFEAVKSIASPKMAVAMELAYYSGQRCGDLLTMRWADIKPALDENGLPCDAWIFRQSKTARKTRKQQGIRIKPKFEEALDRAWQLHPPGSSREFVLVNRYGHQYTGTGFRAMFTRVRDEALRRGLIKRSFRFHDIRAKTASDSKSLKLASQLLGHMDERITATVYDRSIRFVDSLA